MTAPVVNLGTVRYYTNSDVYHYTTDNRPLQDLATNDALMAAAINNLANNRFNVTFAGAWAGLLLPLDFSSAIGKVFGAKITVSAVQDSSNITTSASTLLEVGMIGYNTLAGSVTIQQQSTVYTMNNGGAVTVNFTASGNNINVTFSGYSGTNASVFIKVEQYIV